ELLPDMPSNRYHFPRRNRLVAGLSLATLVVEAAAKSGSLITAREANEQGKQVFAIPSHIDNLNAKGCHQLIREGATLVDHPSQILEDLSIFKSPIVKATEVEPALIVAQAVSNSPQLPSESASNTQPHQAPLAMDVAPHLQKLLNQLDWVGQDLDSLVDKTHTDIATLMGWLIELELMGLVMQRGGLYMRCRP
ncbi:MAG TPA: DNA-protecting protein DprA, partial [Moraxellaceae bacterium]|nr:DNA-protecting protein DprA [Moraxellaceae bacterium]